MEPELSVVLFRRLGWTPPTTSAWSDAQLADGGVVRDADGVGRRDGAAATASSTRCTTVDDIARHRRSSLSGHGCRVERPMADLVIAQRAAASPRSTATAASSPAAGWRSPTGWSAPSATAEPPPAADGDRRHRLPRHAGAGQHPPPPVPEPDPGLPADDRQAAVRLAAVAVPAVARRSTRRRRTCRRGSGWPSWRCRAAPRRPTTSTSTRTAPATCSTAEIEAARDLGMRFHPTRGSMSLSREGRRAAARRRRSTTTTRSSPPARRRSPATTTARTGAMVRIALAPCSPFSVTEELMVRTAELAERLDVRLHTHFAENAEDDEFSLATFGCRPIEYLERTGWCERPHVGRPLRDAEPRRGPPPRCGRRRRRPLPVEQPDPGVGHRAGGRPAGGRRARRARASTARRRPTRRRCGWRRARRCCSPSSATAPAPARRGWRWRWRRSAARRASVAPASSACSRRARSATWRCGRSTGPAFAGAIADPIEAWLRCGPVRGARHDRRRPSGRAATAGSSPNPARRDARRPPPARGPYPGARTDADRCARAAGHNGGHARAHRSAPSAAHLGAGAGRGDVAARRMRARRLRSGVKALVPSTTAAGETGRRER